MQYMFTDHYVAWDSYVYHLFFFFVFFVCIVDNMNQLYVTNILPYDFIKDLVQSMNLIFFFFNSYLALKFQYFLCEVMVRKQSSVDSFICIYIYTYEPVCEKTYLLT